MQVVGWVERWLGEVIGRMVGFRPRAPPHDLPPPRWTDWAMGVEGCVDQQANGPCQHQHIDTLQLRRLHKRSLWMSAGPHGPCTVWTDVWPRMYGGKAARAMLDMECS